MLFEEVFLSIVLISSIGAAATSVGMPWCWPRLDAARSVLKRASTQLADRATRVEWQDWASYYPG